MSGLALDFKNYVLYICSCSQRVAIDDLYFCRHCKVPRCHDCVSTVVDSACISCPHCFEAVPQADAKSKKNKCSHCFQCPMCGSTLTARYVVVASETVDQSPEKKGGSDSSKKLSPSPDKRASIAVSSPSRTPPRLTRPFHGSISGGSRKSPGTKYYYLSCTHCRWSTRDVGIIDKRSPLDFKDRPHPHQERFVQLIAHYKLQDAKDRFEREQVKKQQTGRKVRSFSALLDSSKFKGIGEGSTNHDKSQKFKDVSLEAKDPEPLCDDFYSKPVDIEDKTGIEQQIRDPIYQPSLVADLWPRPLSLIGKKLHRCKGCDHILLKADVNLNSIRFKIHQLALHVFPRIRLANVPKLTLGEPTLVPVSFTNPVNYTMKLSFLPFRETKRLKEVVCCPVLPEGEFSLTANEDVDDIMEEMEKESKEEENVFILTQEPGKLVLKFGVIAEMFEVDSKIAFVVKFTYKPSVEVDKENADMTVEVPVLVNCGHFK